MKKQRRGHENPFWLRRLAAAIASATSSCRSQLPWQALETATTLPRFYRSFRRDDAGQAGVPAGLRFAERDAEAPAPGRFRRKLANSAA